MCFRPDTQALRLENVNLHVMRHVGVRVLLLDADTPSPDGTARRFRRR